MAVLSPVHEERVKQAWKGNMRRCRNPLTQEEPIEAGQPSHLSMRIKLRVAQGRENSIVRWPSLTVDGQNHEAFQN